MQVVRETPHSLKEVTAALKQFADRLPSTHTEATRPQLGSELLAQRPNIKGPKGEAIILTKEYFIAGKGTATNHLKRLLKHHAAGGMAAVIEYLRPYEAFLETPATEAAKAPVADDELSCSTDCASCGADCSTRAESAPAQSVAKKRSAKRITRPAARI